MASSGFLKPRLARSSSSVRQGAVALWRKAIVRDANPWAQLLLAEALEKGDGAPADPVEALALYRAAATQDREPAVAKRAAEALARLATPTQGKQ
jgi:TPR repeat protein